MVRIRRMLVPLLAVLLALPVSAAQASPTAMPAALRQAAAAATTLASGLSIPWGIAPLPDGTALVTERDSKRIWLVGVGRTPRVVYTVTEAVPGGEGGLLGITPAPNFATSKVYFIYYTTATDNRVARLVYGSGARPVPIVTGIPKARIHNGGGLIHKRGGYLFIGTGDTGDSSLAQNTSSLGGKVLKVDSNGRAAPGNRWGRVFSIGHRNVQDLVFDQRWDALWASELGQSARDEVNNIVNGANYGWPTCEGMCNDARFKNPAWTWTPAEASPSGITWAGDHFYVGALRGERVWKLTVSGRTVTSAVSTLVGTYGRVRGVQGRGDGSLWITTSNGSGTDRVIRLQPPP
jgi:glucose/arabinose dehydrogenase